MQFRYFVATNILGNIISKYILVPWPIWHLPDTIWHLYVTFFTLSWHHLSLNPSCSHRTSSLHIPDTIWHLSDTIGHLPNTIVFFFCNYLTPFGQLSDTWDFHSTVWKFPEPTWNLPKAKERSRARDTIGGQCVLLQKFLKMKMFDFCF